MIQTILVVDDEEPVVQAIEAELKGHGYAVITASHGMMAVLQAQKHRPALIILDIVMPVVDGVQAYDKLRELPETRNIPIIFLTGMSSSQIYPILDKGVRVAHLKKPIDPADLLSLVQQILPKD